MEQDPYGGNETPQGWTPKQRRGQTGEEEGPGEGKEAPGL